MAEEKVKTAEEKFKEVRGVVKYTKPPENKIPPSQRASSTPEKK